MKDFYMYELSIKNKNWFSAPLPEFIDYIEQCCQLITKKLLPDLQQVLERISSKDTKQEELIENLKKSFSISRFEIEIHFLRERAMILPYIRELDSYHRNGGIKPAVLMNSIDNPISLVEYEHDFVKQTILRNLHNLKSDYQVPEDEIDIFSEIYDQFGQLEEKICEHFKLVSDILIPKAIELEIIINHKR